MSQSETQSGKTYVVVLALLVLLTLVSWGLSAVPMGRASALVGVGIGLIKAVLVATYFMHLHEAPFVPRLIIVVTALFILLIVFGMLADVAWRSDDCSLQTGVCRDGWPNPATGASQRR